MVVICKLPKLTRTLPANLANVSISVSMCVHREIETNRQADRKGPAKLIYGYSCLCIGIFSTHG